METVTKITGFSIVDKATGEKLGVYPLTIPIGATVDEYTKSGREVSWAWVGYNESSDKGSRT
jgi:hypothetical protein